MEIVFRFDEVMPAIERDIEEMDPNTLKSNGAEIRKGETVVGTLSIRHKKLGGLVEKYTRDAEKASFEYFSKNPDAEYPSKEIVEIYKKHMVATDLFWRSLCDLHKIPNGSIGIRENFQVVKVAEKKGLIITLSLPWYWSLIVHRILTFLGFR